MVQEVDQQQHQVLRSKGKIRLSLEDKRLVRKSQKSQHLYHETQKADLIPLNYLEMIRLLKSQLSELFCLMKSSINGSKS